MALSIVDLTITLGSVEIVRHISLRVDQEERVGLIGASGSGKSMIIKAILGLLPLQAHASGRIELDGVDLLTLPDKKMARLRGTYLGAVFQNPITALNPVATVERNILLPTKLHASSGRRLTAAERERKAAQALESVGLPPALADRYPGQLSGGQAQRVAIAEALVNEPRLILTDEPTTALDALAQREIVDLLTREVARLRASLLFVTHDFALLSRIAHRCYVIDQGRLVEEGACQGILENPQEDVTRHLVESARALSLRKDSERGPHEHE
ncbi:MAG: ATP-binding cassette domain-containing protein [Parascardovia denticolens]